jgi:hypothetical protein
MECISIRRLLSSQCLVEQVPASCLLATCLTISVRLAWGRAVASWVHAAPAFCFVYGLNARLYMGWVRVEQTPVVFSQVLLTSGHHLLLQCTIYLSAHATYQWPWFAPGSKAAHPPCMLNPFPHLPPPPTSIV